MDDGLLHHKDGIDIGTLEMAYRHNEIVMVILVSGEMLVCVTDTVHHTNKSDVG